jgi:hypothetical protein
MVVRAKCDVNLYECIERGIIKLPKDGDSKYWKFEDQELPVSFTELSFFCEKSIPIVFKLEWRDLMKLKEMESKLPKITVDQYYIKDAARKYDSDKSCKTPF